MTTRVEDALGTVGRQLQVFSPVLGHIVENLSSAERFASWEDEVQPQQQLAYGLPRQHAYEPDKMLLLLQERLLVRSEIF